MQETTVCPILKDLSLHSGSIRSAVHQIQRDMKFCKSCESCPCDGVRRFQEIISQACIEILEEFHASKPDYIRTKL